MKAEQKENFAHNLKVARFFKGWSQNDLAKEAEIKPQNRIGNFEEQRGKPTLEEFERICTALEQPMTDMLSKKAKIIIEFS